MELVKELEEKFLAETGEHHLYEPESDYSREIETFDQFCVMQDQPAKPPKIKREEPPKMVIDLGENPLPCFKRAWVDVTVDVARNVFILNIFTCFVGTLYSAFKDKKGCNKTAILVGIL